MLRIDLPCPAGHEARLPDSFGRRFAIFADAEEEFDWSCPPDRAETRTSAMAALPAATRRLNALGATPTYLADWPVVTDSASVAVLRELLAEDRCDVGTQLHPWVNPPHDETPGIANSFAGNLPPELERAKLIALTQRIVDALGHRPIAYRAGRYGIGPATAALLAELGYSLDVSVRPFYDYSHEGGPDFSRHEIAPWWAGPSLLEVPLGVAWTGPLRRWGAELYRHGAWRGALARTRLLRRVALTPEDMPVADALRAIDAMLADGVRLFSLSFHTPSVVPGHTPYVRDARDLAAFWRWWDLVLGRLAREGVTSASPQAIVDAAATAR